MAYHHTTLIHGISSNMYIHYHHNNTPIFIDINQYYHPSSSISCSEYTNIIQISNINQNHYSYHPSINHPYIIHPSLDPHGKIRHQAVYLPSVSLHVLHMPILRESQDQRLCKTQVLNTPGLLRSTRAGTKMNQMGLGRLHVRIC